MKLFISGGCGFIGTNVASHGLDRGDDITIFDNLYHTGSAANLIWLKERGKFRFEHGDIRNYNDISRLIQDVRPDTIFHLAGQVAMTTSIANPRLDFEVNVMGTLNILEAARLFVPRATIIYSSTNKIYGDLAQYSYRETDTRYECIDRPKGFDETTSLDFHSPYGCSKGAADQYMLDYARIYGLKTVVFRHSSMYGGQQFATYDQGWIGWFCQKAIETKKRILYEPFKISGDGKQVRDVLYADDVIRLYFAALEHIDIAGGHAFNIGGGINNSLSLLELFSLLEELTAARLNYIKLPARVSDQRVFVADSSKAKRMLGWEPHVSFRVGIPLTLQWVSDAAHI